MKKLSFFKMFVGGVIVAALLYGCDMCRLPAIKNGYPFPVVLKCTFEDMAVEPFKISPDATFWQRVEGHVLQEVMITTEAGNRLACYTLKDFQHVPNPQIAKLWLVSQEGLFYKTKTKELWTKLVGMPPENSIPHENGDGQR